MLETPTTSPLATTSSTALSWPPCITPRIMAARSVPFLCPFEMGVRDGNTALTLAERRESPKLPDVPPYVPPLQMTNGKYRVHTASLC